MSFDTTKHKILKLSEDVSFNEYKVKFLQPLAINHSYNSNNENYCSSIITHNPVLYDLYNFQGVTYTNNSAGAVPSQYYDINGAGTAWTFNLPVYGYKIAYGIDPTTFLGVGPWKFLSSIVIIKTKVYYVHLTDELVKNSKIISYLYTNNNSLVPNLEVLVDPIKNISLDFSVFHRWVKIDEGYALEYFSIFPYFANLNLKTIVYFTDKALSNESQSSEF